MAIGHGVAAVSRSREGARIEILHCSSCILMHVVAPVRERGLKLLHDMQYAVCLRRSREGARIEISLGGDIKMANESRSREGARIEIVLLLCQQKEVVRSLP